MPVLSPENHPSVQPRLLTEQEAARYLNISWSTLIRWRKLRKGPSAFILAGIIRYSPEQLDKFISQHTAQEKTKDE